MRSHPPCSAQRSHLPRNERGANTVEYAAVTVLVAGVATALFATALPQNVRGLYNTAICQISGDAECADYTVSSPDTDPDASTIGDSPESHSDPVSPHPSPRVEPAYYEVPPPESDGTNRDEGSQDEAVEPFKPGDGVGPLLDDPNTDPPPMPEFVDEGASSGEHGSEAPGAFDLHDKHTLWVLDKKYRATAHTGGIFGDAPHAREYLLHFLDNSGEDVELPADTMLEDVPSFQEDVDTQREEIGEEAVRQAVESDATEPVTFPVSTNWEPAETDTSESFDWFNALGTWQYGQTGLVTAYPPDTPEGEWTYEVDTELHVAKEYDWDPDKTVGPGGMFDQQELVDLHNAGWAQEFSTSGNSQLDPYEGSVP